MEPVSLEDRRIITHQLGRRPRGLMGISNRCVHGYPQVVIVYPLLEGKPFPTMYWLTCPFLFRKIASLEAAGTIRLFEERIHADRELAERLVRAHRSYIEQRRLLLSHEDLAYLEEKRMLPALMERGVGGITDFSRVKCLHLHVAHALAEDNPIGKMALRQIPNHACPSSEVFCSHL